MVDFDNIEQNGLEADGIDSEQGIPAKNDPPAENSTPLNTEAQTDDGSKSDDEIISEVTIEEPFLTETADSYFSEPPKINEYIYNDCVGSICKKSRIGRAVLGVFVIVLATAAVSYTSIFTYIAITEKHAAPNPIEYDNSFLADSEEEEPGNTSLDQIAPPISEITSVRDFPILEQLATPQDAMALPDIYDKVSPSVVGVSNSRTSGTSTGTGIIISSDGYIITNAHVLKNAVEVTIVDYNLNKYTAEIIGSDAQTDLAVLKINAEGLTPCEFGHSSDLRIGELSIVIGNPLGFDLYGTMTTGIISGLNRTVTIGDNTMTLIQTQASINKGNSGGPLINCYGQIIGITSAKVDSSYGEGLGFAIPIDEALPILKDLIEHGYVTGRPMIGFNGENITAFIAMYYRLPQGALVRFVTPDSGAERAGLKSNDIIIGFNGETVTTMEQISEIVNRCAVGDTIILTVYRDGVAMDIEMVLGEITANDR